MQVVTVIRTKVTSLSCGFFLFFLRFPGINFFFWFGDAEHGLSNSGVWAEWERECKFVLPDSTLKEKSHQWQADGPVRQFGSATAGPSANGRRTVGYCRCTESSFCR